MRTKTMILARNVDQAHEDWDRLRHEYLLQHGWEYTSDNPGALWLWVGKMPNGKTFRCDVGTAFAIQSDMTPDPEDEDCDEG